MRGEVDVGTKGVESFNDLERAMKEAGTSGLRRRMYAGLNRSARPFITAARESASTTLPGSGGTGKRKATRKYRMVRTGMKTIDGVDYAVRERVATRGTKETESLADRVSSARFTVRTLKGRNPGVRVTATAAGRKKVDLNTLDKGLVRAPLFGNRRHWYAHRVRPGWFSRPAEAQGTNVLRELETEVSKVVQDITR